MVVFDIPFCVLFYINVKSEEKNYLIHLIIYI